MQMHRKLLNFPYFTLEEFTYALKHFQAPSSKLLLQTIAYQILIKTNNKPPRFENALNCLLAYYENPTSFARGLKIMNEKVFAALNFQMRVECFSQCTAAALAKVNGCVGFIPLGVDLQGQEYRLLYPGYLLIINAKDNTQDEIPIKQWIDSIQMPENWQNLDHLLEDISFCLCTCDSLGNYIYDEDQMKGMNVKLWDKEPETTMQDISKPYVNEAEIEHLKNRPLVISKLLSLIENNNKLSLHQIQDILKSVGQNNQITQESEESSEQQVIQFPKTYKQQYTPTQYYKSKQNSQQQQTYQLLSIDQDYKNQQNLIKLTIQSPCSPSQQRLQLSDLYIQQQLEMLQLQTVNLIDHLDEAKHNIDMKIKIVNCNKNPQFIQQLIDKIQVENLKLIYQQLLGKQPIYVSNKPQFMSQSTFSFLFSYFIQEFEVVTDLCEQLQKIFAQNFYIEEFSYFQGSLMSHNPLQPLSDCKNYFTVTKLQQEERSEIVFRFFRQKAQFIGKNEVLETLPHFVYDKSTFPELIENQPLREVLGYCEPAVKQVPEEVMSDSNEISEDGTESSYSEQQMADDDEDFIPDEEEPDDSDMTFSTDEKSSVQDNDDDSQYEQKDFKRPYEVKYVTWKKYNKKTMISLDEHKHMTIDIVVYRNQQTEQQGDQNKQLEQLFDSQADNTNATSTGNTTQVTTSTAQTTTQTGKGTSKNDEQVKPQPDDLILVREYNTADRRAQSWDSLVRKFYPQEHIQGVKGKTFEQSKSAGKNIRFATCQPPVLKQQQPQVSKKQIKSENKQLINSINKRWEEYRETNGEEAYKQAIRGKLFCKIIQKVITDKNNITGLLGIKQELNEARMSTNTADPASAYKFVNTIMKIVEKHDLIDEMIQQELLVSQENQ